MESLWRLYNIIKINLLMKRSLIFIICFVALLPYIYGSGKNTYLLDNIKIVCSLGDIEQGVGVEPSDKF